MLGGKHKDCISFTLVDRRQLFPLDETNKAQIQCRTISFIDTRSLSNSCSQHYIIIRTVHSKVYFRTFLFLGLRIVGTGLISID